MDRAEGVWPVGQLSMSAVPTFHVALALGVITEP